jgi:hypothetical protein
MQRVANGLLSTASEIERIVFLLQSLAKTIQRRQSSRSHHPPVATPIGFPWFQPKVVCRSRRQ